MNLGVYTNYSIHSRISSFADFGFSDCLQLGTFGFYDTVEGVIFSFF